jgi:hypothetical protein
MMNRIMAEVEYILTEELEGLLWVVCAVIIPTALVFLSAHMDGKL